MLKTLQNFVKIGENFKIPLYLELRSFKTPLYLVLSGPQNIKNMVKKTLPRSRDGSCASVRRTSEISRNFGNLWRILRSLIHNNVIRTKFEWVQITLKCSSKIQLVMCGSTQIQASEIFYIFCLHIGRNKNLGPFYAVVVNQK